MAKILRKRLKKLNARRVGAQQIWDGLNKSKSKLIPVEAFRMPGSMTK